MILYHKAHFCCRHIKGLYHKLQHKITFCQIRASVVSLFKTFTIICTLRNKFISSHSSVSKFAPPACILIRTCSSSLYHNLHFSNCIIFCNSGVCITLCTYSISPVPHPFVSLFAPIPYHQYRIVCITFCSCTLNHQYRIRLYHFMHHNDKCIVFSTSIIFCSFRLAVSLFALFMLEKSCLYQKTHHFLYRYLHSHMYHFCSIGPLYQFMYFVFICAVSLFAPHISFFDTTHCTVFRTACIIF